MLDLVIGARRKDLGGFEVGRVLPFMRRRMVGPFIFFDHMGPVNLRPMCLGQPRCALTRIWGSPPSHTCLMARSCTGTAPGRSRPSGPAL